MGAHAARHPPPPMNTKSNRFLYPLAIKAAPGYPPGGTDTAGWTDWRR